MTDAEAIKESVEAFHSLSGDDVTKLIELNTKIQNHEVKWGVNAPLIYEFLDLMHDKNLLPVFDWVKWSAGSDLFMSEDPTRYDNVDLETALKLIYAVTRKERFADGTLALAFETGFPKLVNRLVAIRAQLDE
jgi:hypothetical protein